MPMEFAETNPVRVRGCRPFHGGEQVVKCIELVNDVGILYEVGVGKRFFLCSACGTATHLAGGITSYLSAWDAMGAARFYFYIATDAPIGSYRKAITFWPPFEMEEGWKIYCYSGAATVTVYGSIFGWVE